MVSFTLSVCRFRCFDGFVGFGCSSRPHHLPSKSGWAQGSPLNSRRPCCGPAGGVLAHYQNKTLSIDDTLLEVLTAFVSRALAGDNPSDDRPSICGGRLVPIVKNPRRVPQSSARQAKARDKRKEDRIHKRLLAGAGVDQRKSVCVRRGPPKKLIDC